MALDKQYLLIRLCTDTNTGNSGHVSIYIVYSEGSTCVSSTCSYLVGIYFLSVVFRSFNAWHELPDVSALSD